MPQFPHEFPPEVETRLRRLIREPVRGVAPGVVGERRPTPRAVPRSALPAWVQQRLREQERALPFRPEPRPTPTPLPRPRPAAPPARASLLRGEAPLEPPTRTEQLRAILDSPVRGVGAGIASSEPSRPRREPVFAPDPFGDDPFFDDQITQDERAARSDAPSVFRALREEERLFDEGLERDVNSSVGSESALERAKNLLRAEPRSSRPPEPLPDATVEDPWLLPSRILGVPVTVDRAMVQLAFRDRTIFGITPEQEDRLDALPEDERDRIEDLADELWIEARGREFATRQGHQVGVAQDNPAFTDWRKIFELATGQPHPDVGGINALLRDAIRLRDGFDVIDDVTSSARNGVILIYEPALTSDDELARLHDVLDGDYIDERARFEAVKEEFPVARFVVDTAGAGTALREGLESQGIVGDLAANFVAKALAPATWFSGPAGAATIIPGGVASALYEEAREFGLPPELAAGATQTAMLYLKNPKNRGALWAYLRERLGGRLDDFGPEWSVVAPQGGAPHEATGGRFAGGGLAGGGGGSVGLGGLPGRAAGGGLGGGGGGSF